MKTIESAETRQVIIPEFTSELKKVTTTMLELRKEFESMKSEVVKEVCRELKGQVL
jgi:hypothetical protein